MGFLAEIFVGVVAALAFLAFGRWAARRCENAVYATGLVVAAFVYLLFALVVRAEGALWVEAAGLLLFAAVAVLGLRVSPWFLAAGWAAHVAWDLALHPPTDPGVAPAWYPVVCIGFDLTVAVYVAWWSRPAGRLHGPTGGAEG